MSVPSSEALIQRAKDVGLKSGAIASDENGYPYIAGYLSAKLENALRIIAHIRHYADQQLDEDTHWAHDILRLCDGQYLPGTSRRR